MGRVELPKKRPISAARNNAHDPELLMEYFKTYKSVMSSLFLLGLERNGNERGYRMGIGQEDWVISVDIGRRTYTLSFRTIEKSDCTHLCLGYQWLGL